LLAEAVDHGEAMVAFHGHAHRGCERGVTPGGVPVRNVAEPVIAQAYRIYCLGADSELSCAPPVARSEIGRASAGRAAVRP
jgi:hypothetical protein